MHFSSFWKVDELLWYKRVQNHFLFFGSAIFLLHLVSLTADTNTLGYNLPAKRKIAHPRIFKNKIGCLWMQMNSKWREKTTNKNHTEHKESVQLIVWHYIRKSEFGRCTFGSSPEQGGTGSYEIEKARDGSRASGGSRERKNYWNIPSTSWMPCPSQLQWCRWPGASRLPGSPPEPGHERGTPADRNLYLMGY